MLIDLVTIDWSAIAALSSIAVATVGFIIGSNLRRSQKRQERYTLILEFRREIIEFSSDFITSISDALSIIDEDLSKENLRRELQYTSKKLSALVDLGRFFFPNYVTQEGNYGHEKGPAFEGYKRPSLDAIIAAHLAVEAALSNGEEKQNLLKLSKEQFLHHNNSWMNFSGELTPKRLLVHSRRTFLNLTVPETLPKEWRSMFQNLLGPVKTKE